MGSCVSSCCNAENEKVNNSKIKNKKKTTASKSNPNYWLQSIINQVTLTAACLETIKEEVEEEEKKGKNILISLDDVDEKVVYVYDINERQRENEIIFNLPNLIQNEVLEIHDNLAGINMGEINQNKDVPIDQFIIKTRTSIKINLDDENAPSIEKEKEIIKEPIKVDDLLKSKENQKAAGNNQSNDEIKLNSKFMVNETKTENSQIFIENVDLKDEIKTKEIAKELKDVPSSDINFKNDIQKDQLVAPNLENKNENKNSNNPEEIGVVKIVEKPEKNLKNSLDLKKSFKDKMSKLKQGQKTQPLQSAVEKNKNNKVDQTKEIKKENTINSQLKIEESIKENAPINELNPVKSIITPIQSSGTVEEKIKPSFKDIVKIMEEHNRKSIHF